MFKKMEVRQDSDELPGYYWSIADRYAVLLVESFFQRTPFGSRGCLPGSSASQQ